MNVEASPARRTYRMRARAAALADNRRRILRAVLDLHTERFHDEITLEAVALMAGVTVQTVLRHFGSRDALVTEAARFAETQVVEQRRMAPRGDVTGAVENLLDHYEEWGASALRLLAQEERVPQLKTIADRGRRRHYEWVEAAFGPFLAPSTGRLLRAKLITLTDVYVWKLLRLDLGLEREEVAAAIGDMIRATVREGRSA